MRVSGCGESAATSGCGLRRPHPEMSKAFLAAADDLVVEKMTAFAHPKGKWYNMGDWCPTCWRMRVTKRLTAAAASGLV